MRDRLPDTIDPASLTAAGREYHGPLPVAGMQRLVEALHDSASPDLNIQLFAARDAQGVRYMEGRIEGTLHLTCQRCLGLLLWPVTLDFRLALVQGEAEAERVAGEYDPLLLDDERVSVRSLIEDEVLLALPDFPQHDAHESCSLPDYRQEELNTTESEKPNPFAVLEKLKQH